MGVGQVYSPRPESTAAMPFPPEGLDVGIPKRYAPNKPDLQKWRKHVLDALGTAIGQSPQQTLSYRYRGEDTLTWGDPDRWIEIKWGVQCLFAELLQSACGRQYGAMLDIIRSARLEKLEAMYSLRDRAEVEHFLQTYPHLINVLLESYPHLLEHFGSDVKVALEVVSDPEVGDWRQLFAYILTPMPVREALDRLDRLDKEWFLDQLDRTDGLLTFDIELA